MQNKYAISQEIQRNAVNEIDKQKKIVSYVEAKLVIYEKLLAQNLESNLTVQEQKEVLDNALSDYKIKLGQQEQASIDIKLLSQNLNCSNHGP